MLKSQTTHLADGKWAFAFSSLYNAVEGKKSEYLYGKSNIPSMGRLEANTRIFDLVCGSMSLKIG
ncbi:hypothetical protein [Microcoleus vaginatus]|nr:hypothetical protein MicvaDRAFT_1092 [Microcoleus vaginatus FGP-2]